MYRALGTMPSTEYLKMVVLFQGISIVNRSPCSFYSRNGPQTSSFDITWELVRNAEPQVLPQTHLIGICTLTRRHVRALESWGSALVSPCPQNLLDSSVPRIHPASVNHMPQSSELTPQGSSFHFRKFYENSLPRGAYSSFK